METNNFDSLVSKIQLENLEIEENKIAQSLIAKLLPADNEMVEIRQTLSAQLTVIQNSDITVQTAPELLFNRLSF